MSSSPPSASPPPCSHSGKHVSNCRQSHEAHAVHRRYGQGAEGTCHHQTVLVTQAATRHRRVHQPQPCGKCPLRCSSVWVTDVKETPPVHPSHCQRSHPHNNTTAADGVPRPPHLGRVLRAKCCSLRHPHFTSTPCHRKLCQQPAHTFRRRSTSVSVAHGAAQWPRCARDNVPPSTTCALGLAHAEGRPAGVSAVRCRGHG